MIRMNLAINSASNQVLHDSPLLSIPKSLQPQKAAPTAQEGAGLHRYVVSQVPVIITG